MRLHGTGLPDDLFRPDDDLPRGCDCCVYVMDTLKSLVFAVVAVRMSVVEKQPFGIRTGSQGGEASGNMGNEVRIVCPPEKKRLFRNIINQ